MSTCLKERYPGFSMILRSAKTHLYVLNKATKIVLFWKTALDSQMRGSEDG